MVECAARKVLRVSPTSQGVLSTLPTRKYLSKAPHYTSTLRQWNADATRRDTLSSSGGWGLPCSIPARLHHTPIATFTLRLEEPVRTRHTPCCGKTSIASTLRGGMSLITARNSSRIRPSRTTHTLTGLTSMLRRPPPTSPSSNLSNGPSIDSVFLPSLRHVPFGTSHFQKPWSI